MLALVARCLQLGLNRRRDPDYTLALTQSRGARDPLMIENTTVSAAFA
jgi:hypothetical protein